MHCDWSYGYRTREYTLPLDRDATLCDLLHADTRYPRGCRVLEAGCGVGARTLALARNSPGAYFTCVDVAAESLYEASARARAAGVKNVAFRQADLVRLPFAPGSYDHVFACFVLEHLARPEDAVASLAAQLRPGGTLTVIEGDHGSTLLHPEDPDVRRAVECLVALQARGGGDALVGRRLLPLLAGAGLRDVQVSPRTLRADRSRPDWVERFTLGTFTAMVEAAQPKAIAAGLADEATWARALRGLRRTAEADGVLSYTFFKGVGVKA